ADNLGQSDDPAFARVLTHNLIGYLSRFGKLRVISEQTSDFYRNRQMDVAHLMTDFGVQYAIAGHVQGNDSALRVDFQLGDTATRTNIWSDHLQRERSDPTLVADEAARGIARVLAIEIGRVGALRVRAKPSSQLTDSELVARGYLALQRGATRENLSDALTSFDEALRRDPHYQPALLAVAQVHIIAAMNFIGLDPSPDLGQAERLLNEVLGKSPNSLSALYSLALLQKYRRQYEASMRSTLSRTQPKLPSGAGADRKYPHENRTTAEGVGTNPSNHPCRDPQRSDARLLVSFRRRGGARARPRTGRPRLGIAGQRLHAQVCSRPGVAGVHLCHCWR